MGWGGVGGHVNVPLHLRHEVVATSWMGWGLGGVVSGMLTFPFTCVMKLLLRRGWGGGWVGWGGACPSLAGTQMIDRAWRSLKFEWLPAHINATQKKKDHTVLSPIVSELVFQWAWRQHQGPMSPNQFLKALQGLLKH